MPTIIAMSYELSHNVLRSAQLAHRLQASKADLRKSEQRMSLAISAAKLVPWEWDIVHDKIWSTDKGHALFGMTKTKRVNFNRFLNALYAKNREPLKQAVDSSLSGGGDYEGEFRIVLPNKCTGLLSAATLNSTITACQCVCTGFQLILPGARKRKWICKSNATN